MIYLLLYIIGTVFCAVYLMKYEDGEKNPSTTAVSMLWPALRWFFILEKIALYIYRKIK